MELRMLLNDPPGKHTKRTLRALQYVVLPLGWLLLLLCTAASLKTFFDGATPPRSISLPFASLLAIVAAFLALAQCAVRSRLNRRRICQADFDAIIALSAESQRLHFELRPDLFTAPNKDCIAEGISALLAKERFQVILAEEDGKPAGYLIYELEKGTKSPLLRARKVIYMHQLSIAPEHRRKGIGKAIIQRVREHARELDVDSIEFDLLSANAMSREFHKSLGFTPVRETMEMRLKARDFGL